MGLFNFKHRNDINARFAGYPSCDHLNIALNILLQNAEQNRVAIEEICWAIVKADGYFYEHVKGILNLYGFKQYIK